MKTEQKQTAPRALLPGAILNLKWSLLIALPALLSTDPMASAQNTVVTYQGRVQSGGSDFTGAGQFKFALVTVSNAAATAIATATISGGYVTLYTVTGGGNGYVTAPSVTVSGGGGSGATATATISGGVVTQVTPATLGSGYTNPPTVTIAPPPEILTYTSYWSNDGTSSAGSEPTTAVTVAASGGLFTARLGDTALANMTALDAGLFTRPNLQLRVWFNDGVNGFAALNPAQPLTATPYAFAAGSASNLLGTVSAANVSGTYGNAVTFNNAANSFSGNGTGLANVNAVTLGGLNSAGFWRTAGNAGTVAGTHYLGTTDDEPLELRVHGLRALRLEPNSTSPNMIGGYHGNFVSDGSIGATIGGGGNVFYTNSIRSHYATITGGCANDIGMGADGSAIGGGLGNNIAAHALYATIAGGKNNHIGANSGHGAIGGGYDNTIAANASYATIPGGYDNYATSYGFAAGYNARALHTGAFVWSDGGGTYTPSATNNSVTMRARNGFRFFTGSGSGGAQLAAGETSWSVLSDRNVKKDFAPVDGQAILERLAALPITQWHYQWEESGVTPHIGPMAQDFKAAFYPGSDDKRITTQEADGVALAAIQGLNEKLEVRSQKSEVSLQKLQAENADLKRRLEKLEQLMTGR